MTKRVRRPLEKAIDLQGIPSAFRPEPLSADEMQFYSDALNERRGTQLQRKLETDLLSCADQALFFKGVVFGNRGTGKSTELNKLLANPSIQDRFLKVRIDALDQLNPQTFGVADVLSLIAITLLESAEDVCLAEGRAFHAAQGMIADMQASLAPFFPELQPKVQTTDTKGGGGELNLFQTVKLSLRIEGQTKLDQVAQRESLTGLSAMLGRLIAIVQEKLPDKELLVIGENFDKEQIPVALLENTFVQYSALLQELPLHLLFTLPVPFVYAHGDQLSFPRQRRYPIYDTAVFDPAHKPDLAGQESLKLLLDKRANRSDLFADDALTFLITASGGDLFLLFSMIVKSGQLAQFRHEDFPATPAKILLEDAEKVVREQLSTFRNEMGTSSNDPDQTTWETKREKLRKIYETHADAKVPDSALYQLLRRRAVLFCNGQGRYAVHPLAVQMLREQYAKDTTFTYKGGGLDLLDPSA